MRSVVVDTIADTMIIVDTVTVGGVQMRIDTRQNLPESCSKWWREEGVEDGIDAGVTVGQNMGGNLKQNKLSNKIFYLSLPSNMSILWRNPGYWDQKMPNLCGD